MKDLGKTLKIVGIGIATVIITVATYLVGYDYGYSAAMDDYMGASECKPSRKWRQRFQRNHKTGN